MSTFFIVRIFIFRFDSFLKNTLANNLELKRKVDNYSTFPHVHRRIASVCPLNNLFSPIKKHISNRKQKPLIRTQSPEFASKNTRMSLLYL